jgi:hypothetical protein
MEWMVFDRLEPLGNRREDINTARLSALLANIFAGGKRSYSPSDFMPKYAGQAEEEGKTSEELWDIMMGWALASGARRDGKVI